MKRLLLSLALVAGSAHAEFYDGNDLLSKLNGEQFDRIIALGYIMGVADTSREVDYCGSPPTVTSGQFRDIVKQYLERNPQTRHYTADVLVRVALGAVWPCKRSTPAPNGRSL